MTIRKREGAQGEYVLSRLFAISCYSRNEARPQTRGADTERWRSTCSVAVWRSYDMRYFWRHLGWGLVAAPLALAGCSTDAPSSPPGAQPTGGQAENVGSAELALQ